MTTAAKVGDLAALNGGSFNRYVIIERPVNINVHVYTCMYIYSKL